MDEVIEVAAEAPLAAPTLRTYELCACVRLPSLTDRAVVA
jgi:hypothetical protein